MFHPIEKTDIKFEELKKILEKFKTHFQLK
jgi:hypothetical protein